MLYYNLRSGKQIPGEWHENTRLRFAGFWESATFGRVI